MTLIYNPYKHEHIQQLLLGGLGKYEQINKFTINLKNALHKLWHQLEIKLSS